ncbi:hypothetical protein CPB83DRAFT_63888 [Crepidotus variabilis]|uniref:DUF6534 domain-containing protein n=1 Tax=Crepidotus variabilis TaxID=179855 RepID=A0A9P6E5Z5_9AGAR|nr:hypothetical protein CPB83DRAFT_63888 [Crepidotus variabilis]
MITGTFGALFIGGIVAILFSGVVTSQAFSYFKNSSGDGPAVKALAICVWGLDFFHSIWVTIALWDHLIAHFGEAGRIDYIPWSLALTIAFTAILTFLVHLFFVYRIYKLSHGNLYICLPLALMACGRLCFACLTTAKMIQLRSLSRFVQLYTFSFTSGLSLSSALDILITSCMCYLLARNQKANSSMNHVLDKLMLYTFENGSLTCAATLASLICWLTNKSNLIFMGLHFVISKFYANSFYATLNARKDIQRPTHRSNQSSSTERDHAVVFPDNFRKPSFNFLGLSLA